MTLHTLENESWQVGVLPETGASIAFGRIKRGRGWLDFMRPAAPADYGNASLCASFPLIPWSNRLRAARFRFNEVDYQLEANTPEGTAIHGVVRKLPWKVDSANSPRIRLTFRSTDYEKINFPFRFSAAVEYHLEGSAFVIGTTLRNEDTQAMPGGFGHHPYFVRGLGSGDNGVALEIPCDQRWELVDKMAEAPPVPITSKHLQFQHLRPLEPEKYAEDTDDVLTHRQDDQPVRIVYSKTNTEILFYSDALFKHLILFAPKGKAFFAVEPVTNTNDGFNLYAQGMANTGVFVLQPGEEQSAEMRLVMSG